MEYQTKEIKKTILLNAPVQKVWKAISTSEGLSAWWMANTFEPVLGKQFVLRAEPFGDSPCIVTELETQRVVGFDWDKHWHLLIELEVAGDSETRFTLIHSGWTADQEKFFETMEGGWEVIVTEKLPAYLAG